MQRVAGRLQPRIVEQALVERAVLAERRADVEIGDARIVAVAHRQGAIDLGVARVLLRQACAGQQPEQQDARGRQALFQSRHHRVDAEHGVGGAVLLVPGVVGADQQHRHLGLQAVHLAVLQPPQHVLGGIAAEPQVERAAAAVEGLPGRLEILVRRVRLVVVVGDRVADQQQRRVRMRARLLQHLLVALRPPGFVQAVGRGGCGHAHIGLRRGAAEGAQAQQQQRRTRPGACSSAARPRAVRASAQGAQKTLHVRTCRGLRGSRILVRRALRRQAWRTNEPPQQAGFRRSRQPGLSDRRRPPRRHRPRTAAWPATGRR